MESLPEEKAVPDTLDWDLWLGIQAMRPYSPAYLPFAWRGWLDFGCGSLGDMACHILGAPNMALRLGAPTSIECTHIEGKSKYAYPTKSTIRFDFPARGSMPPVKIFWYDAAQVPPYRPQGLSEDELLGDLPRGGGARRQAANPQRQQRQQPAAQDANAKLDAQVTRAAGRGSNGSLFVSATALMT